MGAAPDSAHRREQMVEQQLARRGIRDARVLAALRAVPRERFVPPHLVDRAYDDGPLPIGHGQTISQPYVVAWMAEALQLDARSRVLEVGTGSGYAAAVLAELAAEVHSIERDVDLAQQAEERLAAAGYGRVHLHVGDGTLGWPDAAPYDAIVVAAGGPHVPPALRAQLVEGGRLVLPVGEDPDHQELVRVTRRKAGVDDVQRLGAVRFVPLVGAQGWPSDRPR